MPRTNYLINLKQQLINRIKKLVYFCFDTYADRLNFMSARRKRPRAELYMDSLFFHSGTGYVRIDLANIEYIKGTDAKVFIMAPQGTWELMMPLKMMEWMLPNTRFCRIHTNYLVNVEMVLGYDERKIFLAQRELPLAPSCKRAFHATLNRLINEDVNEEYVPAPEFSSN